MLAPLHRRKSALSPLQTNYSIALIAHPLICANIGGSAKSDAKSRRFPLEEQKFVLASFWQDQRR